MRILFFLLFFIIVKAQAQETCLKAQLIAAQIMQEIESTDSKALDQLLLGMDAREKGQRLLQEDKKIRTSYLNKKREVEGEKNLIEATIFFNEIKKQTHVKLIEPYELAYRTLNEGVGAQVTANTKKIIATYSIKKIGAVFPEVVAKDQEVDLSQVIAGFAIGMQGMREGEVRTLYIHPDYGYDSYTYEPCVALEATVELIKILSEQSAPLNLSSSLESQPKDERSLKEIEERMYFVLGWKLWDHFKKSGILLPELILFLKDEKSKRLDLRNYERELNHIHWQIYNKDFIPFPKNNFMNSHQITGHL